MRTPAARIGRHCRVGQDELPTSWALVHGIVDVDPSRLDDEAEHVDVVLPRRVLRAIDSYAERQGETRNGFLARAALDQMRRETASPS